MFCPGPPLTLAGRGPRLESLPPRPSEILAMHFPTPKSRLSSCILRRIAVLVLGALLAASQAVAADSKGGSRQQPISPGEEGTVTLFGIPATGSKYVFVLDRSGSMGGTGGKALAAAKAELIACLDGIDSVQQFQIIFYNETPRIFNPTGQPGKLAFGSDQNKRRAKDFIESIKSDGGTDHENAIMTAIRMRPDVIFLLTDADEPKLKARELDRIDRMGPGIIINTIEFGTGPQPEADNFLVRLARQSRGKHVYVDASK
jgi:hypothetical protein